MHIIFGEQKHYVPSSYTLLELDTFRLANTDMTRTAYCLIETVPLTEFALLEHLTQCHRDMMDAYRDQNWHYVISAAQGLTGRFNGELDSFYSDIAERASFYQQNPPGPGWDGTRDSAAIAA
jgi:hypothetical protein